MKWLGILFALATVISSFGSGNMPQSNNIAVGLEDTFGICGHFHPVCTKLPGRDHVRAIFRGVSETR